MEIPGQISAEIDTRARIGAVVVDNQDFERRAGVMRTQALDASRQQIDAIARGNDDAGAMGRRHERRRRSDGFRFSRSRREHPTHMRDFSPQIRRFARALAPTEDAKVSAHAPDRRYA